MFKSFFKIAIRQLRKNIAFSMINIAGLTIGIACCMLILLYIKDELSFDRFHQQKDHIYHLTCTRSEQDGSIKKFAIAGLVQGPAFKAEIPEIQAFTRVNPKEIVTKSGNDVFNERVTWVDASFFNIFTFPLLSGNPATALSDQHSIVISEEGAAKYFSKPGAAVGKVLQLEINGKFEPFIVTGVAKMPPRNSSIQFTILAPFSYFELASPDNGWMWVSFPTYFLLSPGANIQHVVLKMDQIYSIRAKDEIDLNSLAGYNNHFNWGIQPLVAMHLNTEYEGVPGASDPLYSYILGGIAVFILLIACINFVNLTMAQSLKRNKEIGLRKVMGSKRSQLTGQLLGESVITCLIAFDIAVLLASLALPLFNQVANKQLSLSYLLDWKLAGGFAGLFVVTGFAAGLYPAVVLSAFNPSDALAGKDGLGGKNRLAKALVVVQFASATFLIISTLFIYAQFNLLTQTSVGYPDQDLLSFTVSQGIRSKAVMDLYQSEFSRVPGVINTGYKNIGHFGGKTQAGNKEFTATYEHIDGQYLPTLGVQIIAGRNFSPEFPADSTTSVLINQTLAGELGWTDPVGKTIDYMNFPAWGGRKMTVVGVVKDYHNESLKEKIQPLIFTEEASMPLGQMIVRIKPEHTAAILLAMEKTYHRLNPDHPFSYEFRDEANRRNYASENKWKQIIAFGAVIAIFITSIGLLGLAILSANRRQREIGIRKVLGASVTGLVRMLSQDFIILVLTAFAIAVPAAWLAMRHWLQQFAYRVDLSWWRFTVAGIITLIIALSTVAYQAARAALKNPIKSLRNE
jgi:putative ABC transport system permease protein